jgi:hypothetical protein
MASDMIQPLVDQDADRPSNERRQALAWLRSWWIVLGTLLWAASDLVGFLGESPVSADDVTVVGTPTPYPSSPGVGAAASQNPKGGAAGDISLDDLDTTTVTVIGHPYRPGDHPLECPTPMPSPSIPCPPVVTPPCVESTWYARVDYFQWKSNSGLLTSGVTEKSCDFGIMPTIGYQHAMGPQRGRVELFGSSVQYLQDFDDGDRGESNVGYFGGRGEYEYLWDVDLDGIPFIFTAGIGTAAWGRNIGEYVTDNGLYFAARTQTWWTIYPYIALEKRWHCASGDEFFAMGRVGSTVITYMYESSSGEGLGFYPRPSLTGQAEIGWRHSQFSLSGFFEVMAWHSSEGVHRTMGDNEWWGSPGAQMLTAGLKFRLAF